MTSLSQSTCYNSSLTQAPLWLRLPIELHMLIFSYCDYFTLKQIQRVCKFFNPLLKTTFLNNELFWPTPIPLSREDLQKLGQKRSLHETFTFRLHPLLLDFGWCIKDANVGPVFVGRGMLSADKDVPLADLPVRNESAIYPAVSCTADILVTMWRCDPIPPVDSPWVGADSIDYYLKECEKNLYRTVTVQDVVRMLTQIEYQSKTAWLEEYPTEIWRKRPYPDEANTVSVFLTRDGWVEFDQDEGILSDYSSDDSPVSEDAAT
ncbi:hypothetical protein CF319_g1105 [Tilletia indica]|nr:hypothetical protein CF319_g1105 [Tilletia indica]